MTERSPSGRATDASHGACYTSPPSVGIPSAGTWFAWPVLSDWEEVEVELLSREGTVFRTNAADFDYWLREPRSDMCDDTMAFRIVGLMPMTDEQADALVAPWQRRNGWAPEATYGVASAIEARRAETQSGSVHESAVAESQTPNSHSSSEGPT